MGNGIAMATYETIGYGDREGYEQTSAAVLDEAHAHDASLRKGGTRVGIAGSPVQVRNTEGRGVETTAGPYMTSPLPIAGFGIFEATSLEEAIQMVAGTPCAVAHGVVEVWPLEQPQA